MADYDRDDRFLDRFWDDLTSSEAADPGKLDPDTADFVRRLHALAAPPVPTSAHDRVWRRVTSSTGHRFHSKDLNLMTTTGFIQPRLVSPNGQAPASAPSRGRPFGTITSQHRWLAIVVSAALIVLTLGVVFGPLRPGETDPADRGGIPGAMFAASPSPDDTGASPLFEITIPAKAMPPMGRGAAVLFSMTADRYSQGVYAGNPCCPGILVLYMIDGAYTVRPELGSITVYRAGLTAAPEEIDTGTSVELGPGDVLLAEKNAFVRFSNYGSTPVSFLTWQLLTDNFASDPTGPGFPTGWSWTGRNADGQYARCRCHAAAGADHGRRGGDHSRSGRRDCPAS
jgi:hypothetical protein